MPAAISSGFVTVNGADLYYARYGTTGPIVVLLHGGLANSDYWANQITPLAAGHRVIVLDSRGHGRSTRGTQPLTYALLASDVVGAMDALKIEKASIVGWSDGAIVGLLLAMKNPERVARVFAFAANADPSGIISGGSKKPLFAQYLARARRESARLAQSPSDVARLGRDLGHMWTNEPNFSKKDLSRIGVRVAIADGEHDEIIKASHTEYMAHSINGAKLIVLPGVSHFAMLQDPKTFNSAVLAFLDEK